MSNEVNKCNICGKTFKSKNSLYVHKSNYHRAAKVELKPDNVEPKAKEPNIEPNNKEPNVEPEAKEPNVEPEAKEPNVESLEVTKAEFSKEDLDKAQNDLINNDESAKELKDIIENMTDDDGKELYLLLMDVVGGFTGVDPEKDIPNISERAQHRGKYLAFTINRYASQITKYIIPIILVGGIATDIISMKRLGDMKKALKKAQNKTDDNKDKDNKGPDNKDQGVKD